MDFEQSALWLEVEEIIKNKNNPVHFAYKAILRVNNIDIEPIKVINIDTNKDFELGFSDEITINLLFSMGTYAKKIFPYRSNIEITLIKTPMKELGTEENTAVPPQKATYIATLKTQGSPIVEGDGDNVPSEAGLDLAGLMQVEFELMSKTIAKARMRAVGGIYRTSKPAELIKAVLTKESQLLDLPADMIPLGVDMVEANNTKSRDHIVLPHGLKLTSVARFIQKKCGVYGTDLGFYYANNLWYVYPLYDTTRFDKTPKTLTIINVPGKKLQGIERTYRMNGGNLIILCTGDSSFVDTSDQQQLTTGNGVRFGDANNFLDGFVKTKGNKAVVARGSNVTEVISTPRDNKLNNVQLSPDHITANPFKEYSELAKRDGSILTFLWENANTSLIYPGMPVKVLYLEKDDIKTLFGTVVKAQEYVHTPEQVMFASRLITNLALALFIDRKKIQN